MERPTKNKSLGLNLIVAVLAVIFVLAGSLFPKQMNQVMQNTLNFITSNFGWLFLIIVLGFVVLSLLLAFSKYGNIKLGQPEDKPEYSTVSWFAMLFSAGMGIGLVFWSIGEPVSHFSNPPFGEPFSRDAMLTAMRYTFFHWGIHPWAVYSIVGLTLAYFSFKKRAPLLISTVFQPLIGKRIYECPGKILDGLAVFATVFGVATSLGLGTMQISSGLHFLFGISNTNLTNVLIVAVVTLFFTLSAISGIGRGIKILSNINLVLALVVLLFMLAVGPTRFIISLTGTTIIDYVKHFVNMSLALEPVKQVGWVNGWTVFYWAWWIAWAPFVGAFIARISKGRTIREFILGVIIAPMLLSFLWMGTFGGVALHLVEMSGQGIASDMVKDLASGLFMVFNHYPLTGLLSGLVLILITIFFITSADSATFVVGMFLSGGSLEPTPAKKVFWGVMQGSIAIVLLLTGGLDALQTASIIAAFPFMFVMVAMVYSFVIELRKEKKKKMKR